MFSLGECAVYTLQFDLFNSFFRLLGLLRENCLVHSDFVFPIWRVWLRFERNLSSCTMTMIAGLDLLPRSWIGLPEVLLVLFLFQPPCSCQLRVSINIVLVPRIDLSSFGSPFLWGHLSDWFVGTHWLYLFNFLELLINLSIMLRFLFFS